MSSKALIDICIIPAAGKGSRWAPVSGYLPKEMLPLVDKPVIEWVINEAIAAGCKKIIVIINPHKKVIKKYLQGLREIQKKAEIEFVSQDEPLGIAHALLLTKNIIQQNPFFVALPDLPTLSKKMVLAQLGKAFEVVNGEANIVSFGSFPPFTQHLYSECLTQMRTDGLLDIIHFCPKDVVNKSAHHPGNKLRMSGRYIFVPEIFSAIEKLADSRIEGEIKDTDALKAAIEDGLKVSINGHTYDTGNPENYVRANTAFFKKQFAKAVKVF